MIIADVDLISAVEVEGDSSVVEKVLCDIEGVRGVLNEIFDVVSPLPGRSVNGVKFDVDGVIETLGDDEAVFCVVASLLVMGALEVKTVMLGGIVDAAITVTVVFEIRLIVDVD